MENRICKECWYYDIIMNECRKNSPQIITMMSRCNNNVVIESKFPKIESDEWCGDFKSIKIGSNEIVT